MKRKIEVPIDYNLDHWGSYTDIEVMIKDLNSIKDLGATHVQMYVNDSWGGVGFLSVKAVLTRLETDEEEQERFEIEKSREDEIRTWELKQLRMLKEKYEEN